MKKNYDSFELTIITIKDDVIRTSEPFAPNDAPDVYEPDPFTKN